MDKLVANGLSLWNDGLEDLKSLMANDDRGATYITRLNDDVLIHQSALLGVTS